MPNGIRRTVYVSIVCLLCSHVQAQQSLFSDKPPPETTEPGILLELTSTMVRRDRDASITVDKTAIRRGQPLQILVDGRAFEYSFDRIVQGAESVTWIGRHETAGRVFVTLSPGAVYVDMNALGGPVQIATEGAVTRVVRGSLPNTLSEQRAYRLHRRAMALDRLNPSILREYGGSDRLMRIRAAALGRVSDSGFVPSSDFTDALALGHEPNLRESPGGMGELTSKWAYRTYDQYLNEIRVRSPVRLIYNRKSFEVTDVLTPIYSAEDAPKPAPGDLTAETARSLAMQELTNRYGRVGDITTSAPQLVYDDIGGQLTLGWTMTLTHQGARFDAFVDVKSGKAGVLSMAMPTHTCSANGTAATMCTDVNTTLIIGSDGECLGACGTPVEDAHREAVRLYEEAMSRYQQRGFRGYENNLDPDVEIVTDTTGFVRPDALAETEVDPNDFDARIRVRNAELANVAEIMYHEAAHIYTAAKNPYFLPTTNMTPGTFTLNESIAYILDEISRGTTVGLAHPNAHVNNYVDSFDQAANNAHILSQAFYSLISTPNNVDIQMAEKLLLRAIPVTVPCSSDSTPGHCLWRLTEAMRDVLDMMDDSDEVTGPQELAILEDIFTAMGTVGLGHKAQPPTGSPPPPPPPPSTPFLAHEFYTCANGYTWWMLWWAPVQNADFYEVYRQFEQLMGVDAAPPGYYGLANPSADVHIHACGPGGCSAHSNSVPLHYVCN